MTAFVSEDPNACHLLTLKVTICRPCSVPREGIVDHRDEVVGSVHHSSTYDEVAQQIPERSAISGFEAVCGYGVDQVLSSVLVTDFLKNVSARRSTLKDGIKHTPPLTKSDG